MQIFTIVGAVIVSMIRRTRVSAMATFGVLALMMGLTPATAQAHVRYVIDEEGETIELSAFLREVLGDPINTALVLGGGVVIIASIIGYLRFRPARWDVIVVRETLRQYTDLVPWLLRLSVGLPLVGAGFEGYFFSPIVPAPYRLLNVTIGFLLLFGLAIRAAATIGLISYLIGLVFAPELLLASEFVGGFLAIMVLGGSRPSADQVLQQVAEAERTHYRPIDIVRRFSVWINRKITSYEKFAPTLVRIVLGINFIYLGFYEKIVNAGRSLLVVEQYNLTDVVPVDPGMWVLGAGLTEVALGLALLAGIFTRGVATIAFLMFTLTLFALPDDPVLAHITLFGMVSVLLITGSGPLAIDNWLASQYAGVEMTIEGV